MRKIRALINPKSGITWNIGNLVKLLCQYWDQPGVDFSFQISKDADDGIEKVQRAVDDGVDTVLVAGGDGVVNSTGSALINTDVALGVVPTGSGNGFARHFDVPLDLERAIAALAKADKVKIDVGTANGRPFFVTCSMAWDAAIVKSFEKFPIRGVLPYVLAATYEFIDYTPQPVEVILDDGERFFFDDPIVFTAANLTQFGGGAKIAPNAQHNDGLLELVVMCKQHMPMLLPNIPRLFNGTVDKLPHVFSKKFSQLLVKREKSAPIQVDGELVESPAEVSIKVLSEALTVLVPSVR